MNTVTSLRSVLRLRAPRLGTRNLVSAAFHCREDWAARLTSPIFQRIKLGEFFVDLDRKFTNEYRGSAVDVDIFAQVVTIITHDHRYYHPCPPQAAATPAECEQMEELLYKLRRTPHTIFSPPSTNHGAIRCPALAVDNLNTGAVND